MTRRTQAEAPSFEEALQAAIADLVGCDPEKVELRLRAPGLDGLQGSFQLALTTRTEESRSTEQRETNVRSESPAVSEASVSVEDLDAEADAAADFLEGMLDAMDLPGDLRIKVHDDHVEVEVIEIGSGALIGRRGQTLDAIQELVRCSLQRQFQRRSHVKVDAEGYRSRRLEKLLEKADEAIDLVLDTGEPQRLEPMDVFERKAVHHLVAEVDGLTSRSQGREPSRRVVIEAE